MSDVENVLKKSTYEECKSDQTELKPRLPESQMIGSEEKEIVGRVYRLDVHLLPFQNYLKNLSGVLLDNFLQGEYFRRGCQQFTSLGFLHPKITNNQLGTILTQFIRLEILRIDNCTNVSSQMLQKIFRLQHLTVLRLAGCIQFDKDDFKGLSQLQSLTLLVLSRCPGVTDETLKMEIIHLPELKQLDICYNDSITCSGIAEGLSFMENLQALSLFGCRKLVNKDLDQLYLPATVIHLGLSNVNDMGLEKLSKFQSIEYLYLDWAADVTDKGLDLLAGSLKNLKAVHFCKKNNKTTLSSRPFYVTKKGLEEFKKKYPNVKVSFH